MALKALMLRKKIDQRNKELSELRKLEEGFEAREVELAKAIAEAETDEEQKVVEEEITSFNLDRSANGSKIAGLEAELAELEAELEMEEREQDTEKKEEIIEEKREEKKMSETRNKYGLTTEMLAEAKPFLDEIRSAVSEKRALSNAGLLIPDVFLGIVRENVINYSKLYRHVFVRRIGGEGKLTIMGTIPEAVWTACCGNINELDLGFANATVDCNKVAGFIPVCNAILDDSDINLANEIVEALNISIGKALDKAILYGTGSGMPLGVYTRLAQTSQPAGYPATARAWVDLHSTHKLSIANTVTGVSLFQTIMVDSAVMSGKYSRGEMVWVMNDTTYKFLKAQGMSVNAAGQIVSAVDGQMPGVGGIVEVLDFVPNYNIIAGYFDCYLLGERQGITIESAPLVRFIEDETLFRGKARYDGQPIIAEAFLALAINSADFSAPSFATDSANSVAYIELNKNAAAVTAASGTNHTVQLKARLLNSKGQEVQGTVTWASSAEAKATVSTAGLVTGAASGSTVVTASAGDAVAACNVTVS